MIAPRSYLVLICHDAYFKQQSATLYELIQSAGVRMYFWTDYALALEHAREEILKQGKGPGTYALILETISVVEAPPILKLIVKSWDEKNQLLVEADD